jgi:hypothetical protein
MLDVLRVSALIILPCVLLAFVLTQFCMVANRKPDVKLFQARLLYNPFNVQFQGRYYLTERGIYWRNISWVCFAFFMIGMFLATTFLD